MAIAALLRQAGRSEVLSATRVSAAAAAAAALDVWRGKAPSQAMEPTCMQQKRGMAMKKAAGSTQNNRDSNPKYLGVKLFGGACTAITLVHHHHAHALVHQWPWLRLRSLRWSQLWPHPQPHKTRHKNVPRKSRRRFSSNAKRIC